MAAPVKKDIGYKSEKLQSMVEPLTVRVEKIKNNSRTPIELPAKENSSPGQNFTRDEIPKLELWLLNEWTGGGFYELKVTDAEGKTMEWQFNWDPRLYPEKIPPNTAGAAAPVVIPVPPNGHVGQGASSPPFSFQHTNGGSFSGAQVAPSQAQQAYPSQSNQPQNFMGFNGYPQQMGFNGYPQTGYQMYPGVQQNGWSSWPPSGVNDNAREERKSLEERLRQMELDRMALQHKFDMEKQQQEFKESLRLLHEQKKPSENEDVRRLKDELEKQKLEMEHHRQEAFQREMAALKEMISSKPQAAESEAVARLQAELAQQREESRRQQERLDREKDSERLRQEMRDQREQFERAMRDMTQKQSDPTVELMKDVLRNQQQNAINPLQIASLIKESSSGAHEFSRTVISQFGDIMGVMKQAIETAVSATGTNNESFWERMGEKAIVKGSKALDQFVQLKREQIAADAQGKANEARIVSTKIQADAQLKAIEMQQSSGLSGAAKPVNPTVVAPTAATGAGVKIDPNAESQLGKRKEGVITEQEIFGQAYESIIKLRKGVAEGMPPETVVASVIQGLQFVRKNNVEVMAFELIAQKRWADFVDILIPQSPTDFRHEVVKLLSEGVNRIRVEDPSPSDENDDAEDTDE